MRLRVLPASFRARILLALLILSLVPLAVGGLYVERQQQRTLRARYLEQLHAVATLKSQHIQTWLSLSRRTVDGLAAMRTFRELVAALARVDGGPRGQAAVRSLRDMLDRTRDAGHLTEVFLLEYPSGRVLLSTDPGQEGTFKDDRPYFREARTGPYTQHVYYSITLQRPVVAFSSPVQGPGGQPVAILVGRADLSFLDRLMAVPTGLGETGRAFLVNKFNHFVSASHGRGAHGWRPVFSDGVNRALAGESGTGSYTNHETRAVAAAYQWLPDIGLALVVEIDETEAFAAIRGLRWTLTATLAAIAGVAAVLALVLASGISRPVARLVRATGLLGAGELAHRVEPGGPRELALLAASVNRMADSLASSHRELATHRETLKREVTKRTAEVEDRRRAAETLAEVGRAVSQSLELDVVAQCIADSVRMLLRSRWATLFRLDPHSGDLLVVAESGEGGSVFTPGLVFPRSTGVVGLAVDHRDVIVTADLLRDTRVQLAAATRALIEAAAFRTVLAIPLLFRDTVIGALGVGDVEGRTFTADDVQLAQAFATHAAIALQNAQLYRRVDERAEKLTALSEITRLIVSAADSDEVFATVAKAAVKLLGARAAYVWAEDPAEHVLRPRARHGVDATVEELIRANGLRAIQRAEGVVGRAFESHKPEYITDVQQDPRWINQDLNQAADFHACVVAPLDAGDAVVGVMTVFLGEAREFTAEEQELIGLLAGHTVIASLNARLVEGLKDRQARLEALLEVSHELARLQPVESLLQRIADACGSLLRSESVGIRLVEGDELVLATTTGDAREAMPSVRLRVGESLSGLVAATGTALAVQDVASDPRLIPTHREAVLRLGHRAFLGVPVKMGERVAGVLSIRTPRPEGFSPEDVAVATALAAQAATALENARLYREARTAYAELSRTQEELLQVQKMEAVGRLAGGISHDFNNLLTVIIGRAKLLASTLGRNHAQSAKVEIIEKTAVRAAALTSQLLAFSRKQILQPEVLDLNAVVGSLAGMLRRLVGEDINIHIVPGAHLRRVKADRSQLDQVLVNLVVNARDAMPRGGRLAIETSNVDLDDAFVRAHPGARGGPYVKLIVSDSGCGMEPETVARIFEPFFTTKGPGQGTGLGLSTVYGIVKQHDGYITVESAPGEGTTFSIHVPSTEELASDDQDAAPSALLAHGKGTVLLVEDDEEVRALAGDVLGQAGYTVLTPPTADEAVRVIEAKGVSFSLLLTDVVMPGMSGSELARRARAARDDIKVLFMSGYPRENLTSRALIDPGVVLLPKPFTPESLAAKVREVLDGRDSTTELWTTE